MDLFAYDESLGIHCLCGVDEAGRGPLAGPVYAAAVILPRGIVIEGLNDSKKLSEKKREQLFDIITQQAVAYSVASASVEEIDRHNILQATFLAMRRAVDGLAVRPELCLVDGNRNPELGIHTRLIVKGDATSACIAAASVLAKVSRDRYMLELAKQYPQYQFEKHKGYGTALHCELIGKYGVSEVHRKSFMGKILARKDQPDRGRIGEQAVAEELTKRGYQILDRNYHSRYGEIDIIAAQNGFLAFVEVKARSPHTKGAPAEAVSASKRKKLIQTALLYLQETNSRLQPRFDVAEVFFTSSVRPQIKGIRYLAGAFEADEAAE